MWLNGQACENLRDKNSNYLPSFSYIHIGWTLHDTNRSLFGAQCNTCGLYLAHVIYYAPIECLCSSGLGDEFKARNRCVSYMDHKILESFEEFLIKLLRFKCAVVCFNCFKPGLKQFCSCSVLIGIVWNKTVSCTFFSAPYLFAHSFCPMCHINHQ